MLYFGEKVKGYDIPVFNEREVRAGAGVLFLFAMIVFHNAFLIGNYFPLKVFVIAFFLDFLIRIFINPKYSPSLILGRIAVHKQKPEYAGAPQKKFAWMMGLFLSMAMIFLVVIFDITGPFNFAICILCLTFLFFETAFGICLGCTMYNLFNKEKAKLCPGGACEIRRKEKVQEISLNQIVIIILFILFIIFVVRPLVVDNQNGVIKNQGQSGKECQIPEWVEKIGHQEQWKLHNGCE